MKINTILSFIMANAILLCWPCSASYAVSPDAVGYENVRREAEKGGYELVGVDTLWSWHQQDGSDLLLVDTRQEWEYHSGYIKGARNFPMEPTWLARMTRRGALEQFLGPDRTKKLVFY